MMSDCRKAEIRDASAAGLVHKDVWLVGCQYDREWGPKTITYSFEVAVNHIAGVEVANSGDDVG